MSGSRCVICEGPSNVIGERQSVWITAPEAAPLPGYVCVVAKQHVEEPFDLDDGDAIEFWRDAMAVAKALDRSLRPRKMNYEIHGNTLPHLHMHLFPRYEGDPYEGRPIDGTRRDFVRTREALLDLGRQLVEPG